MGNKLGFKKNRKYREERESPGPAQPQSKFYPSPESGGAEVSARELYAELGLHAGISERGRLERTWKSSCWGELGTLPSRHSAVRRSRGSRPSHPAPGMGTGVSSFKTFLSGDATDQRGLRSLAQGKP